MTFAAVAAVAAAGGATAWALHRPRHPSASGPLAPDTTGSEPAFPAPKPPAAPRPPVQATPVAPAGRAPRRPLVAVAWIVAAAVAVAALTLLDPVTTAGHRGPRAAASSPPPVQAPIPGTPPYQPPYEQPYQPQETIPTPPSPVPVGDVLPPDGSVLMDGDSGEEMMVRVRVSNPAPSINPYDPTGPTIEPRLGYRLVAVSIFVENVGGVPFMSDVEKNTWLVDRDGRTYPRHIEMTDARQGYPGIRLNPRSGHGRVAIFEVKGNVDLDRFRLSVHPGRARQTQDWRLA
ncbi:hypothetical protein Val02_89260 [Virgisporangium aliadipatigenens]|uniref:DUF4352 domain-containing protein n=1 Tax=Virgisporangium aliadipatigenens TaxID=741659 RepID=A0A8J3YYI9_9ACTN|nr:hypothetical protein [Virgisporangium aliadipatigenens]GIJ52040.1 hypothetical protein Val02_89260 [Virgisporangium aliadipatigenens]